MEKKIATFVESKENLNEVEKFCTSRQLFISKRQVVDDPTDISLNDLIVVGTVSGIVCDSLSTFVNSTDNLRERLRKLMDAELFIHFLEEDIELQPDGWGPIVLTLLDRLDDIETNTHRQRILRGLKKKRKNGDSASLPGRPTLPADDVRTCIRLIEDGSHSPKEIQHKSRISKASYYRILHVTEDLKSMKEDDDIQEIKEENNVSDQLFARILDVYQDFYAIEL